MIYENCHVVGYEEKDVDGRRKVELILEDGRRFSGDIVIGADGIWSKACPTPTTPCFSAFLDSDATFWAGSADIFAIHMLYR